MKIQILGPGCAKCFETEKRIRSALSELGVTAEVARGMVEEYDHVPLAKQLSPESPPSLLRGT